MQNDNFEKHNTNETLGNVKFKQVGVVLKKTGDITNGWLGGKLQVGFDCRKVGLENLKMVGVEEWPIFSAEKGTLCL